MIVNRMLAEPAARDAAVTGAAILPIDIVINKIDIKTLFKSDTCNLMKLLGLPHIMIVLILVISHFRYNLIAYQKESANVLQQLANFFLALSDKASIRVDAKKY